MTRRRLPPLKSRFRILAPPHRAGPPVSRDAQRRRDQTWRAWYETRTWDRLRDMVRARDALTCQRTGILLQIDDRHAANAAVVHHITPHRGDWELFIDPANLELVSKAWHDSAGQRGDAAHSRASHGGGGSDP